MSDNTSSVSRYRQQLMYYSNQKQQLQVQLNVLNTTIEELEKTKEKKVYKGIGNIFIYTNKEQVIKENKDLIETIKLKIKNLEKQEDQIVNKINSLTKSNSDNNNKDEEDKAEGVA
jgi:prefoldin beta subunit